MRQVFRLSRILLTGAVLIAVTGVGGLAARGPGISPGQKDRLKALASQTRGRGERVREELRRARMDLFQLYRNYNLDERKAKTAIERLKKAQADLLNMHLDNEVALREILNQDQFDEFTQRMGKRMGGFGPRDEPMGERPPDAAMLRDLGVGQDQAKRIRNAFGGGREMLQTVTRLQRDSKQLMDLYGQYSLDTTAAKKLIASIHDAQQQLAELHHKAEVAMRQVLSEEQFSQLRDKMAERMRDRPRREHWHRE